MSFCPADDLTNILHHEGRLRVWSVIVTILGEVAEPLGGQIAISELIDICGMMAIEPQAVRTAISRLSKEGWVESRKQGRNARYHFAKDSRDVALTAAQNIYRKPFQDETWVYALLPMQGAKKRAPLLAALAPLHPLIIGNQIMIWPETQTKYLSQEVKDALILFDKAPQALPDDMLAMITPSPHHDLCDRLSDICARLKTDQLTPEKMLVVRILMIHFWRRMVLRYPQINAPLPVKNWPLPGLHRQIAENYHLLASKSEPALSGTSDKALIASRFA